MAAMEEMAAMATGQTQLLAEAIEAATNSGSGIEGQGSLSSTAGAAPLTGHQS
jgi:hypothetical protein